MSILLYLLDPIMCPCCKNGSQIIYILFDWVPNYVHFMGIGSSTIGAVIYMKLSLLTCIQLLPYLHLCFLASVDFLTCSNLFLNNIHFVCSLCQDFYSLKFYPSKIHLRFWLTSIGFPTDWHPLVFWLKSPCFIIFWLAHICLIYYLLPSLFWNASSGFLHFQA